MKNVKQSNVTDLVFGKRQEFIFVFGCCCLMLFLGASGSSLSILQTPMLTQMNRFEMFPIVTVSGILGVCIMTPIGGKLGDVLGRRHLIFLSSLFAIIGTLGIIFLKSFIFYVICRIVISLGQGAFTSAPYILVGQLFSKEKVPKNMGLLSSSIVIGTFGGSFVAGLFVDKDMITAGILFPLIFLIVAIVCIGITLPNRKQTGNQGKYDMLGTVNLCLLVILVVMTLSFGTPLGWGSPTILVGATLAITSIITFIKIEEYVEKKGNQAIISMKLFKNKEYSVLLLIGVASYFYKTPMLTYGTMASLKILETTGTAAGVLTLPRTLITMLLPIVVGIWLGKKSANSWKAIAIGTGVVGICLIPVIFISPSMSFLVLLVCFSITGIGESFRAVSVTPAAQQLLKPDELATGTALTNFMNSFSSVIAASVSGSLFQASGENLSLGIGLIFGLCSVVSLIGFLLAVFYIRPSQLARDDKLIHE